MVSFPFPRTPAQVFHLSCWFPEPCPCPHPQPLYYTLLSLLLSRLAVASRILTQIKPLFLCGLQAPIRPHCIFLHTACLHHLRLVNIPLTQPFLPACIASAAPSLLWALMPSASPVCKSVSLLGCGMLLGGRREIPLGSGTILVQSHFLA